MLGRLGIGAARHRALLFKMLADSLSIRCQLLMGRYLKAMGEDVAMNLVVVDGKDVLVDLVHSPGRLLSPEAAAAATMGAARNSGGSSSGGGLRQQPSAGSSSTSSHGGGGSVQQQQQQDHHHQRVSSAGRSAVVPLIPGPVELATSSRHPEAGLPPRISIPISREGSAFNSMSARFPGHISAVSGGPALTASSHGVATTQGDGAPPAPVMMVPTPAAVAAAAASAAATAAEETAGVAMLMRDPSASSLAPMAKVRSAGDLGAFTPSGSGGRAGRPGSSFGALGAVLEQPPDLIRLDSGTVHMEALDPTTAEALMTAAFAASGNVGSRQPVVSVGGQPLGPADTSWARFPLPSVSHDGGCGLPAAVAPSAAPSPSINHRHSQSFDMTQLSSYDLSSASFDASKRPPVTPTAGRQPSGSSSMLLRSQPSASQDQRQSHPQPPHMPLDPLPEGGGSLSQWAALGSSGGSAGLPTTSAGAPLPSSGGSGAIRSPFETRNAQQAATMTTPTYSGQAAAALAFSTSSGIAAASPASSTPSSRHAAPDGRAGTGFGSRGSMSPAEVGSGSTSVASPVPWATPPDAAIGSGSSSGQRGRSTSSTNAPGLWAPPRDKGQPGPGASTSGEPFADLSPFSSVPVQRPPPPKSLSQQQQEQQQERAAAAVADFGRSTSGQAPPAGSGSGSLAHHSHSRSNDSAAPSSSMMGSMGSRELTEPYNAAAAAAAAASGRPPELSVARSSMLQEMPEEVTPPHPGGGGQRSAMRASPFGLAPSSGGQQQGSVFMQQQRQGSIALPPFQQQQQQGGMALSPFQPQQQQQGGMAHSPFQPAQWSAYNPPVGFTPYEAAAVASQWGQQQQQQPFPHAQQLQHQQTAYPFSHTQQQQLQQNQQQYNPSGVPGGYGQQDYQQLHLMQQQQLQQQQQQLQQQQQQLQQQHHQLGGVGGALEPVMSRMPSLKIGPNQDW